jgi:hypothetical protein
MLRSLPSIFNPKISAIKEMKDLDNLTMVEFHGILNAYELRIEKDNQEKIARKEAPFKASKKTNTKEYKTYDNLDIELDEEEANFVRNLKRGIGKYKGKFPLKLFNYGKVGHFASKCPYAKNEDRNVKEDSSFKRYKKGKTKNKKKFYRKKKNLYTNEDNSSSDYIDSEKEEIIFMGVQTHTDVLENGNVGLIEEEGSEIDAKVDLERELISSLNEIEKLRNKKGILKEKLKKYGK